MTAETAERFCPGDSGLCPWQCMHLRDLVQCNACHFARSVPPHLHADLPLLPYVEGPRSSQPSSFVEDGGALFAWPAIGLWELVGRYADAPTPYGYTSSL